MRFWIAIGIVLIDQRCSSSRRRGEEILGFLGMGKMSEIYLFRVSDMVVIKIIDVIHQKKITDVDFWLFHAGTISVLKVGATRSWIGHWNNFFFIWAADLGTTHRFVCLSLSLFFFFFVLISKVLSFARGLVYLICIATEFSRKLSLF